MRRFIALSFVVAVLIVSNHLALSADDGLKHIDLMPVAQLKLMSSLTKKSMKVRSPQQSEAGSRRSYVFLQKFPLSGTDGLFFHTEILVCPVENFSEDDQIMLDAKVASLTEFIEIDESWWSNRDNNCVELGYGGASCRERCCGVPQGADQVQFPLNMHRAMISNADTSRKALYLYGTGDFDGNEAYHHACDRKCWSNWAGTDYNPLTNNCNTFTSTVLSCVYGLSQKKPHLGPSDMVTVHGHCPTTGHRVYGAELVADV